MKKQPTKPAPEKKEPTKRLHAVPIAIPTDLLNAIRHAADMMCRSQAVVEQVYAHLMPNDPRINGPWAKARGG